MTPQTTDHSPLPWAFHVKLTGSENHRGFCIRDANGIGIAEYHPLDPDGDEGIANCALMVGAVNSHARLQSERDEAVKWLKRAIHGNVLAEERTEVSAFIIGIESRIQPKSVTNTEKEVKL